MLTLLVVAMFMDKHKVRTYIYLGGFLTSLPNMVLFLVNKNSDTLFTRQIYLNWLQLRFFVQSITLPVVILILDKNIVEREICQLIFNLSERHITSIRDDKDFSIMAECPLEQPVELVAKEDQTQGYDWSDEKKLSYRIEICSTCVVFGSIFIFMLMMALFGHQLKIAALRYMTRLKAEEAQEQLKKSFARKTLIQDKKLKDLNALRHELL